MPSPKTVAVSLSSPKTVTLVLDLLTAQNLLVALTNALQAGGGKKKKKKKGGKA
jgi:hypothetical protein